MPGDGFRVLPGHVSEAGQRVLLVELRAAIGQAPYYTPVMPRSGRPFSVAMTNLGPLGWVSDRAGYRYQDTHPETGAPWPAMPQTILDLWRAVSGYPHDPEACLVNYYRAGAKMGLHQDSDEMEFAAPVVSVSLGDTAVFRIGGPQRGGPTKSLRLASGDVLVMGGNARLCYHGIDRIIPGTSRLLDEGGRINLTLRRVTRAVSE
ncbi:MAG TPA: alpha-ketoglutarate-dependent dioxygenase AlkB [Aestuariivirgaceae bacterium]|nr:alpha-ketoglutarate-dependent dioxygenase AlkB [Aestuariivirgaceae bacterium]